MLTGGIERVAWQRPVAWNELVIELPIATWHKQPPSGVLYKPKNFIIRSYVFFRNGLGIWRGVILAIRSYSNTNNNIP